MRLAHSQNTRIQTIEDRLNTRFRSSHEGLAPTSDNEEPSGVSSRSRSRPTGSEKYDNIAAYSSIEILKQYDHIKERLNWGHVPPYLKLNESSSRYKQDHRSTFKVISKCERQPETGLKLLSTLIKTKDSTFYFTEEDMQGLFGRTSEWARNSYHTKEGFV